MQARVIRNNGVLKIDIDGKLYSPLSFKSFRPNPRNVSEFYQAGVRLFSVLSSGVISALGVPYSLYGESWVGLYEYDFTPLDRQMDMFIEHAPDAYFAPMIQLDTRPWYLQQHPDAPNSFTHLSQIAWDETWRQAAAAYLKAAIRHCEEKYGDRIYGYFMLCGTTTEWFSERDYEASHPIKEAGFRKWTGDDKAVLPDLEQLNRTGDVFLAPDEADVYRARKFHSETIAELILYFTAEAQSVIRHSKLLGLYYGYLLELGGERLYNDGALAYEKVYTCPDIDMISSPSSYQYRGLRDPSGFMVTQKTLDAHNKLYFLEFDHITHVAPTEIHDGLDAESANGIIVKIPGADSKCPDETTSLNLLYRDFILCNANLAALWWFDMFDGWFRSEGMMAAVRKMIGIYDVLDKQPVQTAAEIAVFAEGESLYRGRKSANLATECLREIRTSMAQCGAPCDIYSICDVDLPQIQNYKLLVFLNQYDLSPEKKKKIQKTLAVKGKTVLWLYAPDFAGEGQLDPGKIEKITGIRVKADRKTHGGLVFEGKTSRFGLNPPYFSVEDPEAVSLAWFEDGSVAAAWKEMGYGTSVYLATCNIPTELLRAVAKMAGVFVYSENNLVYTYPNSQVLGVYNATEEVAVVRVKEDGTYQDLICGGIYHSRNGQLQLPRKDIRAYLLIKTNAKNNLKEN